MKHFIRIGLLDCSYFSPKSRSDVITQKKKTQAGC
jgi:hypothetical protein